MRDEPATYYSVWLCPSQKETPGLHQLLSAEITDGCIRNRRPYKPFGPHVTLASYLGGNGHDEDLIVSQFREFAATIQVLLAASPAFQATATWQFLLERISFWLLHQ